MNKLVDWIKRKRKALLVLFILVSIFSISVPVRTKYFGKPLSRHHEWLSAHTLITLEIWQKNGISNYHFAPVYSYANAGDKDDYSFCSLIDKKGDAYYVSYGPFALMLPYTVFTMFGIPINQYSLIYFGLLVHFLTALFIYLIILKLGKTSFSSLYAPALAAFILYVFSPGTLWFHSNVYFSEVLMQLMLAIGLYVFLSMNQIPSITRKWLIWYGIISFLCVYTEWMGVFFVFFTSVWFFIRTIKNRVYLKPFLIGSLSGIAAVLLIYLQYSSISGSDALMTTLTEKFKVRSGRNFEGINEVFCFISDPLSWKKIETAFNENFINMVNVLAFVLPLSIIAFVYKKKIFFTPVQLLLVSTALLIVFTHHAVFFEFTCVHDFAFLKTGLFMALLIGVLLSRIEIAVKPYKWMRISFLILLFALVTEKSFVSCKRYHEINHAGKIDPVFKDVGLKVRAHTLPTEAVFSNIFISPMVNFYAKRNLRHDMNGPGAREYGRIRNMTTVFFKAVDNRCVAAIRYTPNGDSTVINFKVVQK